MSDNKDYNKWTKKCFDDYPTPENIKLARKAAGLTQSQAAAIIYRTKRNWQQWEGGERRMDLALWELFGIKTTSRMYPK